MPEGLMTAEGRKLGAQPAGAPDTSAFDAAVAGAKDAATDELAPPRREKPVPTADEARDIRKTARKTTAKGVSKPRAASATSEPKDYAKDLDELGEVIWLGASQLPWTKPFAPLLNAQSRAPMVAAWNQAANQNESVRRAVEKATSGGGNSWVLGVAMASLPLAMGAWQIMTASPETKQALAAKADADLQAWAKAKGLVQDESGEPQAA